VRDGCWQSWVPLSTIQGGAHPRTAPLPTAAGWARLRPALGTAERGSATSQQRKRQRPAWEEADSEEEDRGGACHDRGGRGSQGGFEHTPAWKAALADGSAFTVPTVPAEDPVDQLGGAHAGSAGATPAWDFPATHEERLRYWVFRDMHQRGCAGLGRQPSPDRRRASAVLRPVP
jgi:hypothetical protein